MKSFGTIVLGFCFLLMGHSAWAYDDYSCQNDGRCGGCAFSSGSDNLKATDLAMSNLAKSPVFAMAAAFKKKIARVASLTDSKEQVNGYFSIVGASTPTEVARFIGARVDERDAYAQAVAHKFDLTAAQAKTVVDALQTALRGNL